MKYNKRMIAAMIAAVLVMCFTFTACKTDGNANIEDDFKSSSVAETSTSDTPISESKYVDSDYTSSGDITSDVSNYDDDQTSSMPETVTSAAVSKPAVKDNITKITTNYDEVYKELIAEWATAMNNYKSDDYLGNDMLDFNFYNGIVNKESIQAYYALYDIDGNGTKELILNKRNGIEDIIAYIFTIKDGKPINVFGYHEGFSDFGLPHEVPWSRGGSSSILKNGLIDCRSGDYSIYRIADNGYTVFEIASAEPYDYPCEALLAEAKWMYYINGEEVDYDFYCQYLEGQGFNVEGKNTLANLNWINVN